MLALIGRGHTVLAIVALAPLGCSGESGGATTGDQPPADIVDLITNPDAKVAKLKELRDKGLIAFYETQPREVTLYLREMKPSEVAKLPLDLLATVPGDYRAPASSAYLYYTNEHNLWFSEWQCFNNCEWWGFALYLYLE